VILRLVIDRELDAVDSEKDRDREAYRQDGPIALIQFLENGSFLRPSKKSRQAEDVRLTALLDPDTGRCGNAR
jgi:hypothetical protein